MLHAIARKVSVCAADGKFRDINTILPRPGHSRDKAQTTGTVPAIPGRLATMNIYKTYCTIDSFRKAFTSPVFKDPAISANESENHVCAADVKFHGLNFNQLLTDWQSSTDLTEEAMDNIRSCCVRFMLTLALEFERRFPELTFVINNFAFVDPRNRELRSVDIESVADRFPCNKDKLLQEYTRYKFDQNVDDIFHHCEGSLCVLPLTRDLPVNFLLKSC